MKKEDIKPLTDLFMFSSSWLTKLDFNTKFKEISGGIVILIAPQLYSLSARQWILKKYITYGLQKKKNIKPVKDLFMCSSLQ